MAKRFFSQLLDRCEAKAEQLKTRWAGLSDHGQVGVCLTGVTGVLALPFITLTLEKVGYDTFLAARGRDLDAEREAAAEASGSKKIGAHGEFPSGGAALPSFSLIPVASEQSRLVITLLGDKPRRDATIS